MRKHLMIVATLFLGITSAEAVDWAGNSRLHAVLTSASGNSGQMIGIGLYGTYVDGIGFFAKYQNNGRAPDNNYYSQYDILDNTDPVLSRYTSDEIISFGLTRGLSENISLYGGIGVASQKGYADKRGPTAPAVGSPTFNETYTVNDRSNDATTYYGDVGILIKYASATIQLGANSYSKTLEVGIGLNWD